MLKKNKRSLLIVCALGVVMLVGGISAYFTGTDEATNVWTVGEVDIQLNEVNYDAAGDESRTDIVPNSEYAKDPVIENTGTNDAFVFLKVAIPQGNLIAANQDGTRQEKTVQELFDYQWNAGWTVVETKENTDIEGNSNSGFNTYVLAYTGDDASDVCKAVPKGGVTSVLFKNAATSVEHPNQAGIITFKNFIENQGLEGETIYVPVEAYGIQTTDLGTSNTVNPTQVWNILWNQSGAGEYGEPK